MPSVSYKVVYGINTNLVISPSELKEIYFFGIPVVDHNGNQMSNDAINFYIEEAQTNIENYLGIRLIKQIIEESQDFQLVEFSRFGFIRVSYPMVDAVHLDGYINSLKQLEYPRDWLVPKKTNDGRMYTRNMHIIPGGASSVHSNGTIFYGIAPQMGYRSVPTYWRIQYVTGWDRLPRDIVGVIGKIAAVSIFYPLGDLIFRSGVTSQSISIDGLSQSTTGQAFANRLKGYIAEIQSSMPILSNAYKGIGFIGM